MQPACCILASVDGIHLNSHEDLAQMTEREYDDYLGRSERWA